MKGLYGIADAGASGGDPERLAAALLAGGCRIVQLRCKGWSEDAILAVARPLAARCRALGALLIVNDHAEVAVAAGAHGVHTGQLDGSAREVRSIVGDLLVGRSTNDPTQLEEALRDADYVAFGPVFPTPNAGRPKDVRGLEGLREARRLVRGVPLVAIGGITLENLPLVRAAGADAWAVIGAIAGAADPVAATRALTTP